MTQPSFNPGLIFVFITHISALVVLLLMLSSYFICVIFIIASAHEITETLMALLHCPFNRHVATLVISDYTIRDYWCTLILICSKFTIDYGLHYPS